MGSSFSLEEIPAKEAERYKTLDKQVKDGKERAKTELAWFLLSGRGGAQRDPEAAVKLLQDRAYKDDAEALWMLGLCTEYGMGTEKSTEKAKTYYESSTKQKNDIAFFLLSRSEFIDGGDSAHFYGLSEMMANHYSKVLAVAPWKTIDFEDARVIRSTYPKPRPKGSKLVPGVAEALAFSSTITSLSLNYNELLDVGAQCIAEALKHNTTLTSLSLNRNSIGSPGALYLAEALKINTTLKSLFLKDNVIDDEQIESVCECLKANTTLTHLDLRANILYYKGAEEMGKLLKANTTLTRLRLYGNDFSEEIAEENGIKSTIVKEADD